MRAGSQTVSRRAFLLAVQLVELGLFSAPVFAENHVLRIQSTPTTGIPIVVTPNDVNGRGNGTTDFARTYGASAQVTLTAPNTSGALTFVMWAIDGFTFRPNRTISLQMTADHTARAMYLNVGFADLTAAITRVTTIPLIAGHPVTIWGVVTNSGGVGTGGSFWVEFWLRDIQTGQRRYLCDSFRSNPLAPGATLDLSTLSPPRRVYDNVPAGSYVLEVKVDATNEIVESNETNNVATWSGVSVLLDAPDLLLTALDFQPQEVTSGERIRLTGRILNAGSHVTTSTFWVGFRVCPKDDFSTPRLALCAPLQVPSAFPPQGVLVLDYSATIYRRSQGLPEGSYTLGAVVDYSDRVVEQNENNNVVWVTRKKLRITPRSSSIKVWRLYK